jgi:hypothetical protein
VKGRTGLVLRTIEFDPMVAEPGQEVWDRTDALTLAIQAATGSEGDVLRLYRQFGPLGLSDQVRSPDDGEPLAEVRSALWRLGAYARLRAALREGGTALRKFASPRKGIVRAQAAQVDGLVLPTRAKRGTKAGDWVTLTTWDQDPQPTADQLVRATCVAHVNRMLRHSQVMLGEGPPHPVRAVSDKKGDGILVEVTTTFLGMLYAWMWTADPAPIICANPDCQTVVVFPKGQRGKPRKWCTPNGCRHQARVAKKGTRG